MQLNFLFNGFILSYYMREKLDFKYWKLKSLNLSSIFFLATEYNIHTNMPG